jgi:branched-subunit amino acid aminotransferase/4-amino-4-deoxychorismate lyase
MLDLEGFLSETNACNVFIVKYGVVLTPEATSCLPGITRATVISLCRNSQLGLDLVCEERRVSLAEAHCADEVFTTGTMGELSPVVEIDGRCIGDGRPGPVTARIASAYRRLTETEGTPIP